MNDQQIAAERERLEAEYSDPSVSHAPGYRNGWWKRAAIAHAEQAELQAEIDRLRERVRELAKEKLIRWSLETRGYFSKFLWEFANKNGSEVLQLAHEAGVWFDDDGNEVPLGVWKGMVGT